MGEMAAQLAHEIRNPLLAIGATLDNVARSESEVGRQQLFATLVKEIGRMDMILKDHMAGQRDMSLSSVSVAELFAQAQELLRGAHAGAQRSVVLHVDPSLRVRADYDAMKHALFNLLHNALQASPADAAIDCRAVVNERDISLLVEDRGPGLSAAPDQCTRPFFTTKRQGTGLGLAVCQKVASAHGGVLRLSNRQGGGCRAAVVLPRRLLES